MKKLLNGFFLLGFCFVALLSACSDSVYADTEITPDSVVKVHDGDTFSVNIAGCPAVLCEHVPVRLLPKIILLTR